MRSPHWRWAGRGILVTQAIQLWSQHLHPRKCQLDGKWSIGPVVECRLIEKIFEDLPNWTFCADEVSAGCYRVKERNSLFGSNVELSGGNLDELDKAKPIAEDMERQVRAKLNEAYPAK